MTNIIDDVLKKEVFSAKLNPKVDGTDVESLTAVMKEQFDQTMVLLDHQKEHNDNLAYAQAVSQIIKTASDTMKAIGRTV